MGIRNIIEIDEDKCTGCGQCIPNCPEGALQVIDDKARLISDLFCDGLGACIGECPEGAINIIEREAQPYDEEKVMENIVKQGENVIIAHLEHLKHHNETVLLEEAEKYLEKHNIKITVKTGLDHSECDHSGDLPCGCPGSAVMDLREEESRSSINKTESGKTLKEDPKAAKIQELLNQLTERRSSLKQWPVQIMLVPPNAPYFEGADILIAADCVPFAYPGFHEDLLEGKILLVGCPKLDDSEIYVKKITEILKLNDIRSITVAHMEVPCCSGMLRIVKQAITSSAKQIPFDSIEIGIKGDILSRNKVA